MLGAATRTGGTNRPKSRTRAETVTRDAQLKWMNTLLSSFSPQNAKMWTKWPTARWSSSSSSAAVRTSGRCAVRPARATDPDTARARRRGGDRQRKARKMEGGWHSTQREKRGQTENQTKPLDQWKTDEEISAGERRSKDFPIYHTWSSCPPSWWNPNHCSARNADTNLFFKMFTSVKWNSEDYLLVMLFLL